MAKQKATQEEKGTEIKIEALRRGAIKLRIIGVTPMFQNTMSAKAKQTLLAGGKRKTSVERMEIKHKPIDEYRDSADKIATGPTALGLRVIAVKSSLCSAAIETAGLTKAGTQRLIYMPGEFVPLYGIPQLRMDVVRNSDINKTPDVRTRAFLPKWGAEVEIQYIQPQLSATAVVTLLCNAGVLIGVGDFRQEKGKGAFGSFRVIGPGERDAEWDDLVKHHGRAEQVKALANPVYANDETADLMTFLEGEKARREDRAETMGVPAKGKKRKAAE